jgi:hypothetical protein
MSLNGLWKELAEAQINGFGNQWEVSRKCGWKPSKRMFE